MALIKCTVCGHVVSDKARKCQLCGTPIATILTMMRNGQQQTPPNINTSPYQQGFPQQGQSYPQQGQGFPQHGQGFPQQSQGFPQQGQNFPQQGQQVQQPESVFPDASNARFGNDDTFIGQPQTSGQPSDRQSAVNSPQSFKQPEEPFGVPQESQQQPQQNDGNSFWDEPGQGFDGPEGGFSDVGGGFDSMGPSDFGTQTEEQKQPEDTPWQDDFQNDNASTARSTAEKATFVEEEKIVFLNKKTKRKKTGKPEVKRKKKKNIIILSIGVVTLAVLLYFFFVQGDTPKKTSKKNRKQKTETGANGKGANPDPIQEKKERDRMINLIDAVIGTESQSAQPKNTKGMAPKNNRKSNIKTLPDANPYLPKTKESTKTTSGAYSKSKQTTSHTYGRTVNKAVAQRTPTKAATQTVAAQARMSEGTAPQQPVKQQERPQQSQQAVQPSTQSRSIQNAKDNNDFFNGY